MMNVMGDFRYASSTSSFSSLLRGGGGGGFGSSDTQLLALKKQLKLEDEDELDLELELEPSLNHNLKTRKAAFAQGYGLLTRTMLHRLGVIMGGGGDSRCKGCWWLVDGS